MQENYKILSYYKFLNLNNLKKKQIEIKKNLLNLKIKGTVIISSEGVNGTISGADNDINLFENFIRRLLSFDNFDVKNYYVLTSNCKNRDA